MQVRIHNFLEKTKKKKGDDDSINEEGHSDTMVQEQQKLRKNVDKLMKKQKRRQVMKIVDALDDSKSWSTDTRAKVTTHFHSLVVDFPDHLSHF